jgi:uncharacterized protein YdhG (YjbR/CyaY superfamily)
MTQTQTAQNRAQQRSARSTKASNGFTDDERAAMKERSREAKAASAGSADGERDVLAKIAEMSERDRAMAQRIHAIVKATAPDLTPRTWYGMPAYAKDGNLICFFKCADKFKTRYATLGFSDKAHLDDGNVWPTEFALSQLTPADEARISALLQKALS